MTKTFKASHATILVGLAALLAAAAGYAVSAGAPVRNADASGEDTPGGSATTDESIDTRDALSHASRGIGFEGDEGKLFVNIHGGALNAEPASLLEAPVGASGEAAQLHRRNFLDCLHSREVPRASAEAGHRTATICHLNNIAMQLKQSFAWDPVAEKTDNDDANKMLTASMRSPWTL